MRCGLASIDLTQLAGKTVRAVRALLEREPLKPPATQWIYPRRLNGTGVTKASSLNQGFAVPNGRHHLRCGFVHHSVCAHLCLRLGAGSEICRQLSSERKLLDPLLGSDFHLHAKPIGLSRRIGRVQQTKGWPVSGSNICHTYFGP